MKKRKPVKHAHRKAMIAQKKAKGKYSKPHIPGGLYGPCYSVECHTCWANGKYCFSLIF